MFALTRFLVISVLVGLVCAVIAIGSAGLLTGIPLAFLEYLPGDDVDALRKLPKVLLLAGVGGLAIGTLATLGSHLSGRRMGYVVSALVITVFVAAAIYWTHPDWTLADDSGIAGYLESYRVTILAALAGVATVVLVGCLFKPGRRNRDTGK